MKKIGVLIFLGFFLFFEGEPSAEPLPSGSLVLANFQISYQDSALSLADWIWPEPWLSMNLEGNIRAMGQVDEFKASDIDKFDGNVEATVQNDQGLATARASYPAFILSNEIQGFSGNIDLLEAEARMFNILEIASSDSDVELTFSFNYGWLFDSPPATRMFISGGINLVSLIDDSDVFSMRISVEDTFGSLSNYQSGEVFDSFLVRAGIPYVFELWGRTVWSAEGELSSEPEPPVSAEPIPEPGTAVLVGAGLIGLLTSRMMRRRQDTL